MQTFARSDRVRRTVIRNDKFVNPFEGATTIGTSHDEDDPLGLYPLSPFGFRTLHADHPFGLESGRFKHRDLPSSRCRRQQRPNREFLGTDGAHRANGRVGLPRRRVNVETRTHEILRRNAFPNFGPPRARVGRTRSVCTALSRVRRRRRRRRRRIRSQTIVDRSVHRTVTTPETQRSIGALFPTPSSSHAFAADRRSRDGRRTPRPHDNIVLPAARLAGVYALLWRYTCVTYGRGSRTNRYFKPKHLWRGPGRSPV